MRQDLDARAIDEQVASPCQTRQCENERLANNLTAKLSWVSGFYNRRSTTEQRIREAVWHAQGDKAIRNPFEEYRSFAPLLCGGQKLA